MESVHLERVRRLAEAARRAHQAAEDARTARDRAILDANDAGHSHAELGKAAGLSRIRVLHVVANISADRQTEGAP